MQKIAIPIKDSHRLINAGPVILVSAEWQGASTITTVAWHMPVSSSPKLVSVALANKRFSLELLRESQNFCINIPDYSLLDKVIFCGTYSGRGRNKFSEAGLTPEKSELISAPYIKECVAHIGCRLERIMDVGDHSIVVGEVVEAFSEDLVLNPDGVVDIQRVSLIQHLGGSHFGTIGKYK